MNGFLVGDDQLRTVEERQVEIHFRHIKSNGGHCKQGIVRCDLQFFGD